MAVVCGVGQARLAHGTIGLADFHAAGPLNLQSQRVQRVRHVGDHPALQSGLRLRQGVDLFAAVPGLAFGKLGRWLVERHGVVRAAAAAGLKHRLEIRSQQTLGLSLQGLDPVGLQAALHPAALVGIGRNSHPACICANPGPRRHRALAADHPSAPGAAQAVGIPARQIAPRHRHPAAGRPVNGRRKRSDGSHWRSGCRLSNRCGNRYGFGRGRCGQGRWRGARFDGATGKPHAAYNDTDPPKDNSHALITP